MANPRAPSQAPEDRGLSPQPGQNPPRANRRGRSRASRRRRSVSVTSVDDDDSPSRPPSPKPRRKKNQNRGLQLPVLDELADTRQVVNTATGVVGGVAGGVIGDGGNKKDTLRLRLDLNLDVEVTLKARVHGDLTLALLS